MSLSSLVKNSKQLLGGSSDSDTKPTSFDSSKANAEIRKLTYCRVLSGADDESPSASECARAWKTLQKEMSLVPAGSVSLEMVGAAEADTEEQLDSSDHVQVVDVGGCYIDQVAVTCADFAVFVRAGGYEDMTLWPKEIWPNVVQFVDKTGLSGPRWWRQRKPPRELLNHPVVGISWHEAAAYAAWAGKRLPTPAHWQRAGSWHASQTGQSRAPKYPWGDSFEDSRANVWSGGIGGTVAVRDYYDGCTPNGIYQLIGNCWEWVDSRFVFPGSEHSGFDMGEIRGGAFDTYFNSQATCHFRTGQPKHFRAKNIGFRCCVPITDLKHVPGKSF